METKQHKTVFSLLKEKKNWCKGEASKNETGEPVVYYSDKAVKFCLWGAIARIYPDFEKRDKVCNKIQVILNKKSNSHYSNTNDISDNIIKFNDSPKRKHEEIIALLKEARV